MKSAAFDLSAFPSPATCLPDKESLAKGLYQLPLSFFGSSSELERLGAIRSSKPLFFGSTRARDWPLANGSRRVLPGSFRFLTPVANKM
jgi:hypothetical protein